MKLFLLKSVAACVTTGALGVALLLAAPQSARAQVLGTASGYNLFTFDDASNQNVDIYGKVAVGGNANFTNYTIATQAGLDYTASYALVVGGTYTGTNGGTVHGSVYGGAVNVSQPTIFGNVRSATSVTTGNYGTIQGTGSSGNQTVTYGTTFTNAPGSATTLTGTAAQGSVSSPINFAAEKSYLQNLSTQLGGLTTNGSNQFLYGNQTILTGTGSQNVYSLSFSQLASSNGGFTINADSGATVIVNITGGNGTTFTIPNTGYTVNGTGVEKVLFNFVDATGFNLSSFNASILAPSASITGSSGGFQGNLIAKSFSGGGLELHSKNPNNLGQNVLFNGTVSGLGSPSAVPEPGVWVTALSLAGTTGLGLVRAKLRRLHKAV